MEVICLEDQALIDLTERLFRYINEKHGTKEDQWISGEEVMRLLRITSKTTLQNLRDEGKIRFSPLGKKLLLYDRDSVLKYINDNAKKTF